VPVCQTAIVLHLFRGSPLPQSSEDLRVLQKLCPMLNCAHPRSTSMVLHKTRRHLADESKCKATVIKRTALRYEKIARNKRCSWFVNDCNFYHLLRPTYLYYSIYRLCLATATLLIEIIKKIFSKCASLADGESTAHVATLYPGNK
jgi:hypothetical protein